MSENEPCPDCGLLPVVAEDGTVWHPHELDCPFYENAQDVARWLDKHDRGSLRRRRRLLAHLARIGGLDETAAHYDRMADATGEPEE